MNLPEYLSATSPIDLAGEASAILSFLGDSLNAVTALPNADFSKQSLEGLSAICTYLQVLCEAAAAN